MLRKVPKQSSDLTGYVVYEPEGYDKTKKYPVIIMFHGQSEQGNGDAAALYTFINAEWNNFMGTWGLASNKWILVAPQLITPSAGWNAAYWSDNYVTDALRFARQYSIDEDRKIILSISLGGQQGWAAPARTTEFAGVLNICCVGVQTNFCNIKAPVWAFHARNDPRVGYGNSKSAVDTINACPPPVKAKLTTLEKSIHEIWGEVLSPVLLPGESQTAWQWMEQQRRGLAPIQLPVTPTPPNPIPPAEETLQADATATLTSVVGARAVLNGTRSVGYTKGNPWDYMTWEVLSQPQGSTYDIWDMPNSGKIGDIVNLKNLVAGKYKFRLIVKDSKGNKQVAEVELTVSTSGKQQVGTGTIQATGQSVPLWSDHTW